VHTRPDYFDFIDNAQVRNQLQQILYETEEDLQQSYKRTIERYGARVRVLICLTRINLFGDQMKAREHRCHH
jgi:geranylgeranyl pyrophosphate synthase